MSKKWEEEILNVDYFEVETDKKVDYLVNSFILQAIPESYAHYVDTDEQAAQKLRVQLTILLSQQREEFVKLIKQEQARRIDEISLKNMATKDVWSAVDLYNIRNEALGNILEKLGVK
jgi:hypothetical protein